MNKNKQFLNSFLNSLLTRQYYPRRWFNKPKNRFRYPKKNNYNISQNPVRLGYGSTTVRITRNQSMSDGNFISFTTIFGEADEMISIAKQYTYFKVESVSVLIFAHNHTVSAAPSYLYVDWNQKDRLEDIQMNDSVKIVPPFQNNNKIFTYLPPKAPIAFSNTSTQVINFGEWNLIDSILSNSKKYFVFPGIIQWYVPASYSLFARVEMKIHFRGTRLPIQPSQIEPTQFIKGINFKPIKEEEEEPTKPLFYNSKHCQNDKNIFSSKSQPKPNVFKACLPEASNLQGTLPNNIFG